MFFPLCLGLRMEISLVLNWAYLPYCLSINMHCPVQKEKKVQVWPTCKLFEFLNFHAAELCTTSAVEDERYNLKTFKEKVGEG